MLDDQSAIAIRWTGPGDSPWSGSLHHVTELAEPQLSTVRVLAIDPGDPCGVAMLTGAKGEGMARAVRLAECSPRALADWVLGTRQLPDLIVCERPLHGAVRTYDDEPLKVRGFLEYAAWSLGIAFHSVEVQSLKLGHACFHSPQWRRHFTGRKHAFDALAYLSADFVIHREREQESA